ncbi:MULTISPECIES: cyclodeaminase/cyclohydrolase family protein [unclassified Glutamicibacter]|uniref:cyclodeaminase/cyclohydrolase family protein n=1 Tax=unclassified Glutamicibacter TaxID=2627139 RepID=UPI00380838D1
MANSGPQRPISEARIGPWLEELAESDGNPGGGAAAALMLGVAAALMSMSAGYVSASGPAQAELAGLQARAKQLRIDALGMADRDAKASADFGEASAQPPSEQRDRQLAAACLQAAKSSAALGALAMTAVNDLRWLDQHAKPQLVADVAAALGMVRAVLQAASSNLRYDLSQLPSGPAHAQHSGLWDTAASLERAMQTAAQLAARVDARIKR